MTNADNFKALKKSHKEKVNILKEEKFFLLDLCLKNRTDWLDSDLVRLEMIKSNFKQSFSLEEKT